MKSLRDISLFINRHKETILFLAILIAEIYLRFVDLETKSPFGWDQTNNAWAAKNIIINHQYPLLGFQAKLNSGLYIGPLYYYLIAIVYALTGLDPIASGIFAGIGSVFSLVILYQIVKKLFSPSVAMIAAFINTVSYFGIMFDRIQTPVTLIPATSLAIFFCLYKVITGKPKYALLLALALGFSLHIHVTSVYYFIIVALSLPFVPRTKEMFKYSFLAILLFIPWIIPSVMAFVENSKHLSDAAAYGHSYFLGFHVKRVMQLFNDAFIQFEPYLYFKILFLMKFFLIPIFMLIYTGRRVRKDKLLFCYLVALWIIVPWFVMSMYGGEISDYYYSANRFVALFVISYLLAYVWRLHVIPKIVLSVFFIYYSFINLNTFFHSDSYGLKIVRERVIQSIAVRKKVEFAEGVPDSYVYYYYMHKMGVEVY